MSTRNRSCGAVDPDLRILLAAALVLTAACRGHAVSLDVDDTPQLVFDGSWGSGTKFGGPWGHDGLPVETENFMIFSGTASQSARQFTADIAEESLEELMEWLGATHEDFRFLPSYAQPKIHILALGSQNFNNNSGFAYRDGLVTVSREHPNYASFGFTLDGYKRLIKHETMHVVEFLLISDPRYQQSSDVWFREGFANFVSGPHTNAIANSVTSRQQAEAWREAQRGVEGGGNPISIHRWQDFPQEVLEPVNRSIFYYPLFELGVAFLLDPDGWGKTAQDVRGLYEMEGNGLSFAHAFEQNMGMRLDDFEENYWNLVLEYLDKKARQ